MYDLLIRNARVVDGSGVPAFAGDVGVVGGRITAVRAQISEEAHIFIDAGRKVVAPGFVDTHTHDDLAVLRGSTVPMKVRQGVTTVVIGNCGFSLAPMVPEHAETVKSYSAAVLGEDSHPWNWSTTASLLTTLSATPLGQNVRALVGHGPLRVAVMGYAQRAATEQEIVLQEELVAEAMQAGAAGMSLGLMYVPGMYTPTDELIRLARVVGRYGGVVASHMRGEGDHLLSSIAEMLTIGEQAEVAVHISHLKITGRKNWGSIQRALDMIADARAKGFDVTVDVYPYNAGSTTITQLLPPWIQGGGIEQMLGRLRDPQSQRRLLNDFAQGIAGWENQVSANGWERIYLSALRQERFKPLEGLNLIEASEALGMSVEEAFIHLIVEEKGQITVILFLMDDRDVDQVVQSSFAMIGSDGLPIRLGRPHPRLYGTFPRYIRRYVRELGSMSLEEAVHKITARPSARFGLPDRGTIAVGKVADLVIFDPETINDIATYTNPRVYPDGIPTVIVSGQPVVLEEQVQEVYPGQVIAPFQTNP